MADLKLKFKMPDDETLAEYISIKGEKGDPGDPTKTSQLENDSDFTTNAALNAGLATKADATTVQSLSNQVTTNTNNITKLNQRKIIDRFNTGSTTQYALLATLWAQGNNTSGGAFTIHGRIGGLLSAETAHIDVTIANRNGIQAIGDFYSGRESWDDAGGSVDVVVYHNSDGTDSVYLCAKGFVALNIDISAVSPQPILYDGTWTTTEPDGTLAYSLLDDDTYVQKNIAGTISADTTGDAATVNGHTVEADVPFGAVFTDTIYNDSAIRAELDGKADTTEVASQYATKIEVQSLASGAPLVASSTSEMTDTTRVYVNTSDGNWYYYNGSAWVSGGVYQATGVIDLQDTNIGYKAITPGSLAHFDGYELSDQAAYGYTYVQETMSVTPYGAVQKGITASANFICVMSRIPQNAYITVVKSAATNRFRIGFANTMPANGTSVEVVFDDATKTRATLYNNSYNWIVVCYTSSQESAEVDMYVDNRSLVINETHPESASFMKTVESSDLYNEGNKILGEGTLPSSYDYRYIADSTYRTYNFMLEPNKTYTITRTGGNKFRVCLWYDQPVKTPLDDTDTGELYYRSHPNKVVLDNDSATTVSFDSKNFLWCTILYTNNGTDATFSITTDSATKYQIARQYIEDYLKETITPINGGYVINGEANSANSIWSQWNARLAFGMDPSTAPAPAQFNGQIYVNGTIIAHNNGTGDRAHNRWGFHVYEAYASDNYSRMTMLLNKHDSEFDSKPSLEYYYYTGANHYASSYGNVKIGSDVKYHSFLFNRDKMIAAGEIDCRFPVTLARISPANDLDGTYETVAGADSAHEPENQAPENIKCLKYIALKNAANGCMWYDTDRNKVVVKIDGKWHDLATTPVPDGTYDF